MINIAILEDNEQKLINILKVVNNIKDIEKCKIDVFTDIMSTKKALIRNSYNLFITDINLPYKHGGVNIIEGGIQLLIEIHGDDRIHKPKDIIIISEYDDLLSRLTEHVDISHFYHLKYDVSELSWEKSLSAKINYMLLSNETENHYDYDVAIISTLDIEDIHFEKLFIEWKKVTFTDDTSIYKTSTIIGKKKNIRIVKAKQNEMGTTAAALLSSKLITNFRPRYIIMIGIAAGIGKGVKIGDIIFATEIWNYSTGKYVDDSSGVGYKLLPDPQHIKISPELVELSSQRFVEELKKIQLNFGKTDNMLSLHLGPIACGTAVIATKKIVEDMILNHSRKTVALDMESYGLCYAAINCKGMTPKTMIIKSICDFADKEKNDSAHEYASYTSASFAKLMITDILDYL